MTTATTRSRTLPTDEARGGSRPGLLLPLAAAAALLLACAPLSVLFTTGGWCGVTALSVITVCGVGGLLRALPVPLVLVPLAQSAVFVATLTWFLVDPSVTAGPVGSLLAMRDLVGEGVVAARESVAPVDATPQTLALLAVLVFLSALLVETLAVGLGLAGFSGVVLLLLAAAPLGIRPVGPTLFALVAPALGWVLLLAADQTVRMHPDRAGRSEGRSWLTALGLATAGIVCTGLLASALAPAGETPWLRSWWNNFTAPGTIGAGALDPMVDLRSQLGSRSGEQLLQYTSSDGSSTYLRMVTLEVFDGTAWQPYPLLAGMPLERPSPSTTARIADGPTVDVTVTTLSNPYLPLPDGTVTVSLGDSGDWGWDPRTGDAVSNGTTASGLSYSAATTSQSPTAETLADATSSSLQVARATRSLPSTLPGAVADLAAEITGDASSTYDQAVALQTWFTSGGGFVYSLEVPDAAGRDPLLAFLEDRQGFCQQYATAMAVMARTLGIPSRVVVGFTGGTPDSAGWFLVSGANAHAWPELWFDGTGWVRFEPTPAAASAAVTPPDFGPAEPSAEPSEPAAQQTAPPTEAPPSAAPADEPAPGARNGALVVLGCLMAGAGLLSLAVPTAVRQHRRRSRLDQVRRSDDITAGWQEIRDSAVDAGLDWTAGTTIRQQAEVLANSIARAHGGATAVAALSRLVASAEHTLYAPAEGPSARQRPAPSVMIEEPATAMTEPGGATRDVVGVVRALDSLPRSRWHRVAPRSLRPHR